MATLSMRIYLPWSNAFGKARHHVLLRSLTWLVERRCRDFIGRHKFVWSNLSFFRRPLWSEILHISVRVLTHSFNDFRINFLSCYRFLVSLLYVPKPVAFLRGSVLIKRRSIWMRLLNVRLQVVGHDPGSSRRVWTST